MRDFSLENHNVLAFKKEINLKLQKKTILQDI